MSLDPIRRTAWTILSSIEKDGLLELELDQALGRVDEPRDRRFLAELVRGTTQWRDRYDHIIEALSRRKGGPKRDVRLILRLGLHQLLACDRVPPYAAVDQSAHLARHIAGAKSVPYVNGLLQNVSRRVKSDGVDGLRDLFPDRDKDPVSFIASWQSHPRWLIEGWIERFGVEAVDGLCRFDNVRPSLTLRVLGDEPREDVAARLKAAGIPATPGSLSPRALIVASPLQRGELATLLTSEPTLIVQDESVQAATEYLTIGMSGHVLDMCAAPGGKTVHLIRGLPDDSTVVAMDRDRQRLGLVADTAQRTGCHPAGIMAADGLRAPFADAVFDAVLLDGPCSGTGVLRHHPDGRWRLRPDTPARNAIRLLDLAREARRVLKPGGMLLYATCSLEPEENEGVVDRLLSEYPDLEPCAPVGREPADWRRYWLPHRDGADGFFAARIRREEHV